MTHVVSSTATLELYIQHNKNQRFSLPGETPHSILTCFHYLVKITFLNTFSHLSEKVNKFSQISEKVNNFLPINEEVNISPTSEDFRK